MGVAQPLLADTSAGRTTSVGHSGPTATKNTLAALDKQVEAPTVRQVESSQKDDGLKQPLPKPVVSQKPARRKSVLVILVIFIISLLVVFAGIFGVQQDKWPAWQDKAANWWRDFSTVQTIPEAADTYPQVVVEEINPDSGMAKTTESETALPLHSETISNQGDTVVKEAFSAVRIGERVLPAGEDQVLLVEFAFDSTDLSADSRGILDRAVAAMVRSGDSFAVITGYSDNRGAAAYNLNLSHKRADVVAQYLVSRDIGRQRLRIEGQGSRDDFSGANTSERDSKYGVRRVVEIRIGTTGLQ